MKIINDSALSQTKDGARLVQINDIFRNNVIEAMTNAEANEYNKEKLLFCQDNGSLILESSVNSYLKKVAKHVDKSPSPCYYITTIKNSQDISDILMAGLYKPNGKR